MDYGIANNGALQRYGDTVCIPFEWGQNGHLIGTNFMTTRRTRRALNIASVHVEHQGFEGKKRGRRVQVSSMSYDP